MSRLAWIIALTALVVPPAVAQNAFPDLRGTWKGDSESIVWGNGNAHYPPSQQADPRLTSIPFTFTIDKQEGRRLSGTFSSPKSTEAVIGVISRTGTIFLADDDGTDYATLIGPNRMEICHLQGGPDTRIAACTEYTRQQ